MTKCTHKQLMTACMLAGTLMLGACTSTPPVTKEVSIVPITNHLEETNGAFVLKSNTSIGVIDAELIPAAEYLADMLSSATGYDLKVKEGEGTITLALGDVQGKEGAYTLTAESDKVNITGNSYGGVIAGIESLRQLFPPQIESKEIVKGTDWAIPAVNIQDAPRFEWRGIMLDVSRHFFTMAEVKRMIDTMSLFKLNRLHLHLTDGPGWRMEIRKYPLLTSMSAWRVPLANGEWNWQEVKLAIQEHDPEATYGGFYTREQMREIIAYARSRQVTIVPEIDLPGHSYAAMHAYGDLICDGVDFPVEGKKGRDAVCMGRPETLRFVKDVVDELKAVFPPGSPIHLGHDEVSAEAWKKCRYCQNRLKDLNETDLKALSRDFLQQIADYVRKDGYDAIVWDEAGELEADKHIFVMAWRGNDFAAAAVRKGHPVILAPCSHFYFDYYQSSAPTEPKAIGGLIPLRQVYGYELPELSPEEASKVRGLQANIWTEYLYDMGLVEYMAWPRALALAERAWSDCDPRDYKSFRSRAALALKLLEKLAVKYRPMDEED